MNKEEKAHYDFKAVRETMKESHHVHKEIAIELLNSLEKRHLELLEPPQVDSEVEEALKRLGVVYLQYYITKNGYTDHALKLKETDDYKLIKQHISNLEEYKNHYLVLRPIHKDLTILSGRLQSKLDKIKVKINNVEKWDVVSDVINFINEVKEILKED